MQRQLGNTATSERRVRGGLYFTIEGPSCTGKDTQIAIVAAALREKGYLVIETKQPGGTPIGAGIRSVVLRPDLRAQFLPKAEAMLYWADRIQQHETVVKPALREGAIVLGSRDFDSSYVYQCALHGLPQAWMDSMRELAIGSFAPTKTIVLMIGVRTFRIRSAERKAISGIDRNEIRLDEREDEQFSIIREAFLERARKEPERFIVIDAERAIPDVTRDIIRAIESHRDEKEAP